MYVKKIQQLIDDFDYWDARVTYLQCNYFADEIELIYENRSSNIIYKFIGCYKSFFNHDKKYNKFCPIKDMSISQLPYFLQDVQIGEKVEEGMDFYTCKINMFPLYLEVWCEDIKITKQEK